MKSLIAAILLSASSINAMDYLVLAAPEALETSKRDPLELIAIELWGKTDTVQNRSDSYNGWVNWVQTADPSNVIKIYCVSIKQIKASMTPAEIQDFKDRIGDSRIRVKRTSDPEGFLRSVGLEPQNIEE